MFNLLPSSPWHRTAAGVLSCSLFLGLSALLQAENWPQWRGPFFNGATTETNLPVSLDKTNALWAAPLPGKSGSTPIIWQDRIFLSSPDSEKNIRLFCLNRLDGKVLWDKCLAKGDAQVGKNNAASTSPVTDGKTVWLMCATGDIAAYDFTGRELWKRNLASEYGAFAYMWMYGSSPLLLNGKLYIPLLQRDIPTYPHSKDDKPTRESFLLCLDGATGKTLWRQIRPTDAREESHESYATPTPFEFEGRKEILLLGGDYATGHDPETGAELWRCGGLNAKKSNWGRVIASITTSPGMIYACASKREVMLAIKAGGKGMVPDSQVAWKFTEFSPDVCTPLYYQDKLFVLDGDKQVMTCMDPRTGEKKWQDKLGVREIFSASPTGADGKIYCFSEEGTIVVLSAGNEFKILSTVNVGEGPSMSTIVAAQGRLFVRTSKNLYCFGNK
jgi:outer membrane protein assembly factor BamB